MRTCYCLLLTLGLWNSLLAEEPAASIRSLSVSNGQATVQFDLYPAAQQYKILQTPQLNAPFLEDPNGTFQADQWTGLTLQPAGFFQLQVLPIDKNVLLASTVLNRLAYGPTPDEWERVLGMGPQKYIEEQLAPESIQETLALDDPPSANQGWEHVTATGSGTSSILYIYLAARGDGYIDDINLVAGTNAGVGANLIRNGDFEVPLTTNDWTISPNHALSLITTEAAHSGASSLKLVASEGGTTQGSSIWQTIAPALSSSRQYTLSFWFLADTNRTRSVTVRLSGSTATTGVYATTSGSLLTRLTRSEASIDTLRSWHVSRAIESKRQLLEVLLQFCENHFVTEYSKSRDYFDQAYPNVNDGSLLATQMEFREIQHWRQALLNPQCTFYDLLKISAESPAMIIYLDTVTSRGDGTQTANENYGRELLELFTFGVDNGYDQTDIVEGSKAWTGWRVELLATTNQFDPMAQRLTDLNPKVSVTNLVGLWNFKYRTNFHNANKKTIFAGKVVPDRFGPPYAGRNYQLDLPARSGTNGIQDGYAIITHIADQPFTQEFISVKLCRLFVHDDFAIGYNFTDPNLSAEGQLVHRCMQAWENGSPRKGQLRDVLRVIFNSELFQGNAGSLQKVKTPLEFTVSAVRALRAAKADGTFTAQSDGNFGAILDRMGGMRLFDRAEPDGYPEAAPPWISAGTLAERLRFVQALLIASTQSGRADAGASSVDPVALLKRKVPTADWTNAGAVADFFLGLLYPAEGKGNLAMYRTVAVNFLNTADSGSGASTFASLSTTTTGYDTRVRAMVAMLMTLQRFQEQ